MMSAVMDMYLSASDSMSFQDVLDIDIKTEIDSLVDGHNDFSGVNFNDLPPLDMEDVHDIRWFNHSSNCSLNLDFNTDDYTTRLVNPNAIMPSITLSQSIRSPSPTIKESHLTFSPANLKLATTLPEVDNVKKDLLTKLDDNKKTTIPAATTTTMIKREPQFPQQQHHHQQQQQKRPIIKTITKVTPIITKSMVKINNKTPTILTFKNTINKQINNNNISIAHVNTVTNVRSVGVGSTPHRKSTNINNNHTNARFYDDVERAYPKPAYSYSCLIAMALKNSRSGSLPVSEIYNFMCRHFPYFLTAPNGWKNSVRHNLSLNKCFEKIEKPPLNGSQRKGCLWAMNPAKISKMDEEVQKWSRKDPSAIKKAMINPEYLELLERGEMKFSCSYYEDHFGDSCGSAESEEGSDYEVEVENNIKKEYEIINNIKVEETSDLDIEVNSDVDIEVSDGCTYEDIEDDQEMLRVEMALAQKELLEYERNNKRRRINIIQN